MHFRFCAPDHAYALNAGSAIFDAVAHIEDDAHRMDAYMAVMELVEAAFRAGAASTSPALLPDDIKRMGKYLLANADKKRIAK